MKLIVKYRICLYLFLLAFSLYSCSESETPVSDTADNQARFNFLIRTTPKEEKLTLGGDDSFSSLALYIFNKADQRCEYSELIPEFTPQRLKELSRSVNVSPQTKIIYAIANYNDPDKTFSTPVTSALTLEQLENLTVSGSVFSGNSILMVGKKEVPINSEYVVAEIPMQRLAARLDIYMFKNQELAQSTVTVTSVEFRNQVLTTYGNPDRVTMPADAKMQNVTVPITENGTLQPMPSDLSEIIPANAKASFYTYRNMVPDGKPDANTPYIRITALFDGISYTYRGYLTDQGQTTNKYSLLHNTVYRVMAMLDHPDNQLVIQTTPYPWSVVSSEIGHEVTEGDYRLQPFNGNDTGATTGVVQFPYIWEGEARNETSYADYSFSLTAPAGAVWTATLTNGLDFTFGTAGSVAGTPAVSKGIARDAAYEIKIGAAKPWNGTAKRTLFYITVDGVKLKINPLQNGTRPFPGDNDTDILISQTEYK
ncbi:MAG TPA: DUF4906 domain-containing protein [Candidatus Bacteroides intestinigallinarum]|nr:DUF4906 domain-containing protein [Candidatus Bacteroides intestinigallinarum]